VFRFPPEYHPGVFLSLLPETRIKRHLGVVVKQRQYDVWNIFGWESERALGGHSRS